MSKNLSFLSLPLVSLALITGACGGDPEKEKGNVNGASARTSVDQVGGVSEALTASNGAGASSAVQAMTSASQSIVTPAQQMPSRIGLIPPTFGKSDILRAATGTAECTPSGCTFTNYGDDSPTNGFLIDGTISRSGDTLTFDLSYDVKSPQASVDWTIDGSVTATATLIDGSLHTAGATSGQGGGGVGAFNVSWDIQVEYRDVVLDAQGCPTGGSIYAATTYELADAPQGAGGYAVEGTATFGPACGQVTAE